AVLTFIEYAGRTPDIELTHERGIGFELGQRLRLRVVQRFDGAGLVFGDIHAIVLFIGLERGAWVIGLEDGGGFALTARGDNANQNVAYLQADVHVRLIGQPHQVAVWAIGVGEFVDNGFRVIRPFGDPVALLQLLPGLAQV